MTLPTISVVIPCHNAGPYLAECLGSVFAQTRRPTEVILVDDGSTDDSRDVASRFPVRLLRTTGRQGNMTARATGVAAARGDYVAMIDADDRWAVDHLERTAALLDRFADAGLAGSGAEEFGDWTGVWHPAMPSGTPGDNFWRAFEHSYVPNMSVVVRRDALRQAFVDHEALESYANDYLVTLRLAHAYPVVATGLVTVFYRRHGTQMSANPWRQRAAVHRHRAHFIAQVENGETPERLREMRRLALAYWLHDFENARRDPVFLRALLRVAHVVPGVPLRAIVWGHIRLRVGPLYDRSAVFAPVRRLYRLGRRITGHAIG